MPGLIAIAIPVTNNVALVGTNFGGTLTAGPGDTTASFAMPASVVAGNSVFVGVNFYTGGVAYTYAAGDITKTGAATIGTITLDAASNASTTRSGSAIWRVPITGPGPLTLIFTRNGTDSGFIQICCAEFTGLNASPLDAGGTGINTGSGTSHTTGTVTSASQGVIFYCASELGGANFVRTFSDTLVRNDQSASSGYTGIVQYKIINSSPNTLTDVTGADSSAWQVAFASYKTS